MSLVPEELRLERSADVWLSVRVHHPNPDGLDLPAEGGARAAAGLGPLAEGVATAAAGLGSQARDQVPVLLVHGFGSSGSANWGSTGWLRAIGRAGMTAITVDLRGHGESAKPHDPGCFSLEILMADLRFVMAALPEWLGPTPLIDLVGYSLGGRLVTQLAAEGFRPGPTRRPTPSIRRVVIGGYDGRQLFDGVHPAQLLEAEIPAGAVLNPASQIASVVRALKGNDPVALAAFVAGMTAVVDAGIALPPVPALVAAGFDDALADRVAAWTAGLPQAELLIVPGRNHISTITSGLFRSGAVQFLRA